MLIVQLVACLVMSSLSTSAEMTMRETQNYAIWRKNISKTKLFLMKFLLFFVEYSSLIPVSLIVSIEIAKAAQSYFIDFDQLMFSNWRKRKAYARIAALNE
jgi:magnesium-transporting ATPase (P-type)